MSRLHPRCGTTFLLFVISISIILHAVLVPLLLFIYCPEGAVAKQALTIVFKSHAVEAKVMANAFRRFRL